MTTVTDIVNAMPVGATMDWAEGVTYEESYTCPIYVDDCYAGDSTIYEPRMLICVAAGREIQITDMTSRLALREATAAAKDGLSKAGWQVSTEFCCRSRGEPCWLGGITPQGRGDRCVFYGESEAEVIVKALRSLDPRRTAHAALMTRLASERKDREAVNRTVERTQEGDVQ